MMSSKAWSTRHKRGRAETSLYVLGAAALAVIGVAGYLLTESAATPPPDLASLPASTASAAPIPTQVAVPGPLAIVRDGTPLRVLFAGDSLTGNYFASSAEAGFRSRVATALGPVELTTAELADQTLTTVSRIVEVPADLDLAVVELGTNDVGTQTPFDQFTSQYRDLLGKITTTSPGAALICAGTWQDAGEAYDAVIEAECLAAGGRYVPLVDIFEADGTRGPVGTATPFGESDTFHPNDSGHRQIADAILAALTVS
ncbi:SGNH/GDSL hydrolase family protein [Cryobacterium sp. TMB3-1-2]|nr:SGNH/GDSL hydrolase family protein [Cryobacterium sp. TMB3-1-2]TFC67266.1 SGNH/GDSL hydrolase family protein [Cryobacterium sp. TMB3-15]TFC73221.1 SGNH/GDSL hydrolase family protein [Cryobacterium sp. TMB3-10]TFD46109.1 SGNH/GDSL hydrolase family protein [Cryobacterium sp. TMB3-12]